MTKSGRAWLGLLVVAALALAAPAQAHGAAPVREIDARVLADDDGLLGYGGCVAELAEAGACEPAATGLDLLVLDVREAYLGAEPAIVFRIAWQTEGPTSGQGLVLQLEAAGAAQELTATTADGTRYTSPDFDRLDGPVDAFDGFPKALDGWVTLSRWGLAVGDELTGITVHSTAGGEPDDLMPGGWMLDGQEVPHVPEEPDPGHVTEAAGPGSYVVKGPAPLLTLNPPTGILDAARAGNLTLVLHNPLGTMAQALNVSIVASTGVAATLDRVQLTLDPGATREVTLRLGNETKPGQLRIVAMSDLGGRATSNVTVAAPLRVQDAGPIEPSSGAPTKDTPGPSALVTLLALALAGGRRR